jgi:hypothetical protein
MDLVREGDEVRPLPRLLRDLLLVLSSSLWSSSIPKAEK